MDGGGKTNKPTIKKTRRVTVAYSRIYVTEMMTVSGSSSFDTTGREKIRAHGL